MMPILLHTTVNDISGLSLCQWIIVISLLYLQFGHLVSPFRLLVVRFMISLMTH